MMIENDNKLESRVKLFHSPQHNVCYMPSDCHYCNQCAVVITVLNQESKLILPITINLRVSHSILSSQHNPHTTLSFQLGKRYFRNWFCNIIKKFML